MSHWIMELSVYISVLYLIVRKLRWFFGDVVLEVSIPGAIIVLICWNYTYCDRTANVSIIDSKKRFRSGFSTLIFFLNFVNLFFSWVEEIFKIDVSSIDIQFAFFVVFISVFTKTLLYAVLNSDTFGLSLNPPRQLKKKSPNDLSWTYTSRGILNQHFLRRFRICLEMI